MKKEYINVNTNKLHDELIENEINPLLVESLENKTWITFEEGTDMNLVQQIIDTHDPSPLPISLTENQQRLLDLEMAMSAILGGGF